LKPLDQISLRIIKVLFIFAVLKMRTFGRPGLIGKINFESIDKKGD